MEPISLNSAERLQTLMTALRGFQKPGRIPKNAAVGAVKMQPAAQPQHEKGAERLNRLISGYSGETRQIRENVMKNYALGHLFDQTA